MGNSSSTGYQGLSYVMTPHAVLPQPPFVYSFTVIAERNGVDGSVAVDNTRYIPVRGTTQKESPLLIPVATDPTLIYTVRRDPPGGGSFTTLHSGTTIDFALSVDTLETMNENDVGEVTNVAGENTDVAAPFDAAQSKRRLLEQGVEIQANGQTAPADRGIRDGQKSQYVADVSMSTGNQYSR